MILNKTPVRTAINYGINDTQVEDSVFNVNVGKFDNAIIENLRLTTFQNKANSDIVSPISNELLEQSQKANYFLTASSSFTSMALSVGCEMPHCSAALAKLRWRSMATMYFSCCRVIRFFYDRQNRCKDR